MKKYTLECCVDSVESAVIAANSGATRLELCSSLITGGLSPSLALFQQIRARTPIRIHVLLRPRFGDFLYSDKEFDVLCNEVDLFREAGADGIVIGMLTPDGALDEKRMKKLMDRAGKMWVTLHRAFDMCADPFEALEAAKRLGVDAILTSGQRNTCTEGKELLNKLRALAGDDLEILIGSGVNSQVISAFVNEKSPETSTLPNAFHMSGKRVLESGMRFRNPFVSMGAADLDEYAIWQTDGNAIKEAVSVLKNA